MNYNKKTVRDIDVAGKKVLLRCDFNVPMAKDGSGVITDDKRIRAALPTIQYLLEQNAAVVACSHMGKPKGEVKPELSLEAVARPPSGAAGVGHHGGGRGGPRCPGQGRPRSPARSCCWKIPDLSPARPRTTPPWPAMASLADVCGVRRLRRGPPRPCLHRRRGRVPALCLACSSRRSWEVIGGALADPKAPLVAAIWAAPRYLARSGSSTTCWRSPTPSSSAARLHLLRRPGRQGGTAGGRLGRATPMRWSRGG